MKLALVVIVTAVAILMSACELHLQGPSPPSPMPISPVSVKLTTAPFSEPPGLGSETSLTVEASIHPSSNETLPNTSVGIELPEGMELISGETQWTGTLSRDNPATLSLKARFVKEGAWSLSASAKSYFTNDSWYGDIAYICYYVSENAIAQESRKCPDRPTSRPDLQEAKTSPDECAGDADCAAAGCSGQLCVKADGADNVITTCEYRAEYDCLKLTSCGCNEGRCAWEATEEYESCLEGIKNK